MIDFMSAVIVAVLELAFPVAVQWFIDRFVSRRELADDRHGQRFIALRLCAEYLLAVRRRLSRTQIGHQH